MIKIIDSRVYDVFTLNLRSDGILHVHIASNKDYYVEELKGLVKVVGEMTKEKKVPLYVTLDEFALPNAETREFWSDKNACPYFIAEAYLAKTLAHKLIGKFYLTINKPQRPTKIASSEEGAIQWLKTFL